MLDADQRHACLLGLDDTCGLAVDVDHVIGEAAPTGKGEFAYRHPASLVDTRIGNAADMPARRREEAVDLLPGSLLRRHSCC